MSDNISNKTCYESKILTKGSYYEEEIDKSKFPGAPGTTNARCMTGDVSLPVTELAAKQVLSLPVYPALSGKDPSTITRGGYGLYATNNSSHQRRRGIVWKV